jgi:hypothetical protein
MDQGIDTNSENTERVELRKVKRREYAPTIINLLVFLLLFSMIYIMQRYSQQGTPKEAMPTPTAAVATAAPAPQPVADATQAVPEAKADVAAAAEAKAPDAKPEAEATAAPEAKANDKVAEGAKPDAAKPDKPAATYRAFKPKEGLTYYDFERMKKEGEQAIQENASKIVKGLGSEELDTEEARQQYIVMNQKYREQSRTVKTIPAEQKPKAAPEDDFIPYEKAGQN